jgi:hypothetical protein
MPFDDSRAPRMQPLGLDIVFAQRGPLKDASVQAWVAEGQLTTSDGYDISAQFGPFFHERLTARNHADVCMELDPRTVKNLRAGEYRGQIAVSITDGQPFSFPLTVTFRSSRWSAVTYAGLGVLLGLIVKICSELTARHRSNHLSARAALANYLKDWNFPVLLILGAISGWLGYVEIYAINPTWGASGFDALKLFGTCFGFQLGSIGGLDLARRLTSEAAAGPEQPTVPAT